MNFRGYDEQRSSDDATMPQSSGTCENPPENMSELKCWQKYFDRAAAIFADLVIFKARSIISNHEDAANLEYFCLIVDEMKGEMEGLKNPQNDVPERLTNLLNMIINTISATYGDIINYYVGEIEKKHELLGKAADYTYKLISYCKKNAVSNPVSNLLFYGNILHTYCCELDSEQIDKKTKYIKSIKDMLSMVSSVNIDNETVGMKFEKLYLDYFVTCNSYIFNSGAEVNKEKLIAAENVFNSMDDRDKHFYQTMLTEMQNNFQNGLVDTNMVQIAVQQNPPVQLAYQTDEEYLPGINTVRTLGDGDCLLHALRYLDEANFNEEPMRLRKKIAEKLQKDAKQSEPRYINFLEINSDQTLGDYLYKLEHTKQWCGHVEIMVLSEICMRPILVIDATGKIRNSELKAKYIDKVPIYVYYVNVDHEDGGVLNHYEGLVLNGISDEEAWARISNRDKEVRKHEFIVKLTQTLQDYDKQTLELVSRSLQKTIDGCIDSRCEISNDVGMIKVSSRTDDKAQGRNYITPRVVITPYSQDSSIRHENEKIKRYTECIKKIILEYNTCTQSPINNKFAFYQKQSDSEEIVTCNLLDEETNSVAYTDSSGVKQTASVMDDSHKVGVFQLCDVFAREFVDTASRFKLVAFINSVADEKPSEARTAMVKQRQDMAEDDSSCQAMDIDIYLSVSNKANVDSAPARRIETLNKPSTVKTITSKRLAEDGGQEAVADKRTRLTTGMYSINTEKANLITNASSATRDGNNFRGDSVWRQHDYVSYLYCDNGKIFECFEKRKRPLKTYENIFDLENYLNSAQRVFIMFDKYLVERERKNEVNDNLREYANSLRKDIFDNIVKAIRITFDDRPGNFARYTSTIIHSLGKIVKFFPPKTCFIYEETNNLLFLLAEITANRPKAQDISTSLWGLGKLAERGCFSVDAIKAKTEVINALLSLLHHQRPNSQVISNCLWSLGRLAERGCLSAAAINNARTDVVDVLLSLLHQQKSNAQDVSNSFWSLGKLAECDCLSAADNSSVTESINILLPALPEKLLNAQDVSNSLWGLGKLAECDRLSTAFNNIANTGAISLLLSLLRKKHLQAQNISSSLWGLGGWQRIII